MQYISVQWWLAIACLACTRAHPHDWWARCVSRGQAKAVSLSAWEAAAVQLRHAGHLHCVDTNADPCFVSKT